MGVQGQGSNEFRAILLDESHKLDPQPLDEGPSRPTKWQIKAKPSWHYFLGKLNWVLNLQLFIERWLWILVMFTLGLPFGWLCLEKKEP